MLAADRRRRILDRVAAQQSIEAQLLADELGVSAMTIRRDIKRLEQDGFLRQTYGGATVYLTKSVELAFNSRALQYSAQKRLIGARAAEMIEPGQTLFLGEGTTTAQFAQFLPPHPHLTVMTNSLAHASLLSSRGIQVLVLGGKLDADEMSVGGPLAEDTLRRFFADVCVVGASGVDPVAGITEQDHEVAALHRLMMERAHRIMLVADHSKIGFRAAAVVCPLGHRTTLVTDEDAPAPMLAALRQAGVDIVCVGQTLRAAALPGAS